MKTILLPLLVWVAGTMSLLAQPVITTQPLSRTNNTGETAQFTTTASGLPAPIYQWQKDGVAIAAPQIGANDRIFVISGPLLKQADKKYRGDEHHLKLPPIHKAVHFL